MFLSMKINKIMFFFYPGLALDQLQAEDQPPRTLGLPEHGDSVSRRLPVRVWWQGHEGDAVGPQRWQAPPHPGPQRHHHSIVLLAQQILAVCCLRTLHQDLGKLTLYFNNFYAVHKISSNVT